MRAPIATDVWPVEPLPRHSTAFPALRAVCDISRLGNAKRES